MSSFSASEFTHQYGTSQRTSARLQDVQVKLSGDVTSYTLDALAELAMVQAGAVRYTMSGECEGAVKVRRSGELTPDRACELFRSHAISQGVSTLSVPMPAPVQGRVNAPMPAPSTNGTK